MVMVRSKYGVTTQEAMSVSFLRDCVEACGAEGLGLTEEQLLELDRKRLATPPSKHFMFEEALEEYEN